MIIKTTSSTRRISISGTTFGSAATPCVLPTNIPMSHLAKIACERTLTSCERTKRKLLACLELGSDQADLVDAGATHDVDGFGDVLEHGFVVAFHKGDFLGAFLEDLLDARAKLIPIGVILVNFHLAVLANLDDDGFILQLHILLLIGIRLRHKGIETLGHKRRDDHENNDQHEKNINQRNYVWRRERA